MSQKKMAIINDLSGFGRCSLTVQLPLISAYKIQACPVPTGIFSNHTAYKSYKKLDMTDFLPEYIEEWKKLGITFDGICIGYLTRATQTEIVIDFLKEFKKEKTIVLLDPVMGDCGNYYKGMDEGTADSLRQLLKYCDIVTPNTTEASFLTKNEFNPESSLCEWEDIAKKISSMGPEGVIITGIESDESISNLLYLGKSDDSNLIKNKKVGKSRPGTGDIFSGIIAAEALQTVCTDTNYFDALNKAVVKASDFISKCIKKSDRLSVDLNDGVCFESFMNLKI